MSKSRDETGDEDRGASPGAPPGKAAPAKNAPAGDEREARLAAALRANLRRRKAATRPPESGR